MNQPSYPLEYHEEITTQEQAEDALRNQIKPILTKKTKGNKHYKVGYALERDVKIALEQDGYTVFRSAGSHSQADLIAIKSQDCDGYMVPYVTLIQCKRHRNLMTVREINTFKEFCKKLSCNGAIAWRDSGLHLEFFH